jgi:CRP-like cAMP-binding protein
MAVDCQSEEGLAIRQLIPLATLPYSRFKALCGMLVIEEAKTGQYLFKRGDASADLFYLLKGAVTLQIDDLKIETIYADSESARFALAHQIPRKVNVIAGSKVRFIRLSPDMMKFLQDNPYEESNSNMIDDELADNDDWMTTLLKSPIFRVLPPANLQKILMSLQEIRFKAGEIIIEQGKPGDYYYIIKKGLCVISRKPSPHAKEIKLGQLSDQDSFGEDALISGLPRNVSISALTDVSLLRLGKEHFVSLIKQPVLKYVNLTEAQDMVSEGAELIDVREPDEYQKFHLPNSINVPFFSLRMQLKTLNRQRPTIVVCRDGKTSETASFLLLRYKFNAYVLRDGISSVQPTQTDAAPIPTYTDNSIPLHLVDKFDNISHFQSEIALEAPSTFEESGNQDDIYQLRQLVLKLNNRCSQLEADKTALEQRCALLSKQVEALEEELKSGK